MGDRKVYILVVLLSLALFIGIVSMSNSVVAASSDDTIYYYGSELCGSCAKIQWVLDKIEEDGYTIVRKDVNDAGVNEEFSELVDELGMGTSIPTLVKGKDFLQGSDDIEEGYADFIASSGGGGDSDVHLDGPDRDGGVVSLGVVLLAGLIDGVNPCAISMLLFFMTLLINSDKKNILTVSLSYCMGIFAVYFSIGLGASYLIDKLGALKYARLVLYIISLVVLAKVFFLEYGDYKSYKAGDLAGITNELDKDRKDKIHKIFRSNIGSKFVYITTFVVGLVVGVLEFSCTGQVYIPTVNYMVSTKGAGSALGYLLLYNIMFILPLVIVTLLVYKAKDSVGTMGVSVALVEHRGKIIMSTMLLYLVLALYFVFKVLGELKILF